MTTPYTYLIGWPDHNKWYYGVRYAKNCHPSDLFNPYKTSSKEVHKLIKLLGLPQVQQIRKTFTSPEPARLWENRVLKKLKVVLDEKWINKTDNKSILPLYGEDHPNSKKRGIHSPFYGIERSYLSEIKRAEWINKNPMHNPVSKEKSIQNRSGEKHHMKRLEVKEKVSGKNNWIFKDPIALEERRKHFIEMNTLRRGMKYEKIPCTSCGISMPKNNYKRHFKICSGQTKS